MKAGMTANKSRPELGIARFFRIERFLLRQLMFLTVNSWPEEATGTEVVAQRQNIIVSGQ